ncbi:MAG: hypothetical protein HY703_08880 [Gemmatimonadetes bacterium]|nr:hypothetical protein [Gemmatimonadota bacterium]
MAVLFVAAFFAAAPAAAQRPRVGLGFGGGVILGSRLVDHIFVSETEGEGQQQVTQTVDISEVAAASLHAEWYPTRYLALRLHVARGSGRLEPTTFREQPGDMDGSRFETGFGAARISALDAGLSVWPWTPRSVGFAPFITVGVGTYRYSFEASSGTKTFFRPGSERSQRALVVGMGADMLVWSSIVLRFEAMNHMVDVPLGPNDFANFGTTRPSAATELGGGVSNVRLILGAHMYFPVGGSAAVPQ